MDLRLSWCGGHPRSQPFQRAFKEGQKQERRRKTSHLQLVLPLDPGGGWPMSKRVSRGKASGTTAPNQRNRMKSDDRRVGKVVFFFLNTIEKSFQAFSVSVFFP